MEPTEFAGVIGTVEHDLGVLKTPAPAQLLDGVYGRRYAVAVTEQHGLQSVTIDESHLAPIPHRPTGTRTVAEVLSFLDEIARRPLTVGTSTLAGDYTAGTVTAVYNDHNTELGGWRDDRLVLRLVPDPDWVAWHKLSGAWFAQNEFGDKLEELVHTVVAPDQAELLEVVDSIRASSSGSFESKINRHDGSQSLSYTEEVTASAGRGATGRLEVPKTITLRLTPWEGHVASYDVEAWFQLRVNAGQLRLAVKLKPTQQLLRTAWADVVGKIIEHTADIPVLAVRGDW